MVRTTAFSARGGPASGGQVAYMYYLYILKSLTKPWHYIGITENTDKRLSQHNSGETKSTKAYRPLKIVYTEAFDDKISARKREIFFKEEL